MSRIFKYFLNRIELETIREVVQRTLRFKYMQETIVEVFRNTYIITLYTPRLGFNIGIQGNSLNLLRNSLVQSLNSENIQLNLLSIDSLEHLQRNRISAKLITEKIGQMILSKINYKKACAKILNEITEAGVLGAKIELRGPLKKIRREEFIQSIGNYKLITTDTQNCEVCHQTFILAGGAIGVTVTIVHRQEALPDNISIVNTELNQLIRERQE